MDAINTQNTFTDAEFLTEFRVVTEKNGLSELVAGKEASFLSLARMMLEFNSHTNITAITDLPGLILSHFCDSLRIPHPAARDRASGHFGDRDRQHRKKARLCLGRGARIGTLQCSPAVYARRGRSAFGGIP